MLQRDARHSRHERARDEQHPRIVRIILLQQLQLARRRWRSQSRHRPRLPILHRVRPGRLFPIEPPRRVSTRHPPHPSVPPRSSLAWPIISREPPPTTPSTSRTRRSRRRPCPRRSPWRPLASSLRALLLLLQRVDRRSIVRGLRSEHSRRSSRRDRRLARFLTPRRRRRGRRGRRCRHHISRELGDAQPRHVLAIASNVGETL